MGSEYRAEKDILANELFDGRLEKFGVREHGQARENYRCLTDGESCLGVRINDAGCVTGFERAWNGVWGNLERIHKHCPRSSLRGVRGNIRQHHRLLDRRSVRVSATASLRRLHRTDRNKN
jgi:hypothetical protein